ncbi:inorganic phosphate transporter [Turneriella parva]|uniref:Phosphate transporter n=1 Tax=Turneriella parva (strain ATCC BAA-1111 / DSM 21527 / NCTC 11395 / H) TaxID=869212 RepID=I4B7A3_TURPD|nr:inorganic phosphate transporter [Turneriella parva]AFM13160.1 phosphate transporter [Turneriella parva DSM 21527]
MTLDLFVAVVILALVFDFINGFHDAANSIATIVSTRVLTPLQAVFWAAFFNFLAFYIFHLHVADTVSKTVDTSAITLYVIMAGLLAAITWNLITWYFGIPSSSSHTLIGGFAGGAMAHAGFSVVKMAKIWPILLFIVAAPFIGMVVSYFNSIVMLHICKNSHPQKAEKWFRRLQLISSAAFSLGHGGNDAQKVMGIIGAAMLVNGNIKSLAELPQWVVVACYVAIGSGTLFGGWRIVKTMGSKITKLTAFEGVASEAAGAVTLFATGSLGIPVSTTHTITGSIIGVGLAKRISAVRWGVTVKLFWAWIITIPISAVFALGFYHLIHLFVP